MNALFSLAAAASGETTTLSALLSTLLPFVVIIVVFYFLLIKPQKKKEKEEAAMRNNLEVGDEVTTRGGIVGTVRQIKDDEITIETGAANVRITIQRWAVAAKNSKVSD